MSKSKKGFKSGRWADDEDNELEYDDYRDVKERRRQKQMANVLRSKDIGRLMELEEDYD